MQVLGHHVVLDMQNCDAELLNNAQKLRRILYDISRKSNMTPLKDVFHTFSPHGVTAVILLAESHVSIHTWPEFGYAAVDFFTCNLETDLELVVNQFISAFEPTDYDCNIYNRGERVLTPHRIEEIQTH